MIYLDHAATSFPKPAEVSAAVLHWLTAVGVSADRGDGPHTHEARREVQAARAGLAGLAGVPVERLAFTSGATEGLNLVLRALLRPGDRVLTTAFEHSSVVRPLLQLAAERDLTVEIVAPADTSDDTSGGTSGDALDLPAERVIAAIARTRPHVVVFTHASNVTGQCFDAAAICRAAREHGAVSVLDACQTIGLHDVRAGADVLVASAHKALHGPPGLGFVAAAPGVDLLPQKQGGTGSSTALERHPVEWPAAFEAGTANTPAIFGAAAALRWLAEQDRSSLLQRGLAQRARLVAGLAELPALRVFAPAPAAAVPVVSFTHEGFDPAELGGILAAARFHVRTGFHCAPWLHRHLGTERGGTVRVSPGPATEDAELDALLALLRSLQ